MNRTFIALETKDSSVTGINVLTGAGDNARTEWPGCLAIRARHRFDLAVASTFNRFAGDDRRSLYGRMESASRAGRPADPSSTPASPSMSAASTVVEGHLGQVHSGIWLR